MVETPKRRMVTIAIKGQLGREAVMSGVSIEYTGRASKFMGRRSTQARIENPRKFSLDKYFLSCYTLTIKKY